MNQGETKAVIRKVKTSNTFDIRMQVKLCPKHLKIFKSKVKLKTKNIFNEFINPGELVELWRAAEKCFHCEWKTTFGKR